MAKKRQNGTSKRSRNRVNYADVGIVEICSHSGRNVFYIHGDEDLTPIAPTPIWSPDVLSRISYNTSYRKLLEHIRDKSPPLANSFCSAIWCPNDETHFQPFVQFYKLGDEDWERAMTIRAASTVPSAFNPVGGLPKSPRYG